MKQAPGPKRMPLAKPPKGHLEFLLRSLIERGLWEQAHLQKLLFPPLCTSSPTQSSRWDHTSCACSEKPALLPFAQRQCRDRLRLRGLKSSSWPRGQPGPGQQKQCHRDKRLGLVATVTHPLYPQQRPQGIALRSVPQRAPGLPRASPLDPPLAIDHSKNVN